MRVPRKRVRVEPPTEEIDTGVALRAMAMENSLLQSYRALFIGIEGALLASAFALTRLPTIGKLPIGVPAAGLVICVFWIVVCEAKGKDVNTWMKYLTERAEEKQFFSYMKGRLSLQGGRLARRWFNDVMPSLIVGLWIWMVQFIC